MFISFVDGFNNVGVSSLGVFVLIKGEGDFVNFDLEVLNDVFFGLSSYEEVSRLQLFEVFLDVFQNSFFIVVQLSFFSY